MGSHLGSAYVKATFFEQVRMTNITVALESLTPAALTWSGKGGACTSPGEVVVDCMSLAVFNKLKGSANTVGAAAPAADEKKWDETKTNFLSDVVSMIAYFDTIEAVQNDKSLVFKEMLLAFQMILRAATKQTGVSPTDLRGAFDLLENTDCGRRIAEGLNTSGVGAAIAVDARELLVEGELDKDCDENFLIAAESILSTGVEDVGDMDFFMVTAKDCPLDARETDMPRLFLDGVMKLSDALTHWSTRRASEEIKALIELVNHMGRNLAIFDAARNHVCFKALYGVRKELAKCFLGVSSCDWPPPVLPDLMIIEDDGPEDETCILKLCRSLLHFLRGGMPKASSLDATLQKDVNNLEAEAGKLRNHVVMRQSMWRERKAMETLLSAVWDPSEGGSPPCLPTWRNQATASSSSCWRSLLAAQPRRTTKSRCSCRALPISALRMGVSWCRARRRRSLPNL